MSKVSDEDARKLTNDLRNWRTPEDLGKQLEHYRKIYGTELLRQAELKSYRETYEAWELSKGMDVTHVRYGDEPPGPDFVFKNEVEEIPFELTQVFHPNSAAHLGKIYSRRAEQERGGAKPRIRIDVQEVLENISEWTKEAVEKKTDHGYPCGTVLAVKIQIPTPEEVQHIVHEKVCKAVVPYIRDFRAIIIKIKGQISLSHNLGSGYPALKMRGHPESIDRRFIPSEMLYFRKPE